MTLISKPITSRLAALGIHNTNDLLHHYPDRYEDYSTLVNIAEAPLDTAITIQAVIKKISSRKSWQRRQFSLVDATVTDNSGDIKVVWFNQNYITEQLKVGTAVMLSGKIKQTKYGKQLVNPVFEKAKQDTVHTGRLVPHYPTTYRLTQKHLRYLINQALAKPILDWLPDTIIESNDLISSHEALRAIHFPETIKAVSRAKHRLAFDELLTMQLVSQSIKDTVVQEQAQPITIDQTILKDFTDHLPFILTNGQTQAITEIVQDLQKDTPMNRLLEGDVGAGKTVVAALAMYACAKAGYQAILMAPTEVLAQQHFDKLIQLFKPFNIPIGLITAHHKVYPTARLVVGTHALLTTKNTFPKLTLAIIDEQHRFGVSQRQSLQQKTDLKLTPHLLSMTATPIPRTLALTAYGDLSLSIIDELPKNRKPITTQLITNSTRAEMYKTIAEHIKKKQQIYIVAPRIAEDETSDKTSVEQEAKRVQAELPNAKLAVIHGQLKAKDKHAIMEQFRAGNIDILVSTTVIEVGVDVPNATVMVIENAEIFGLAQLHQLRGRVGRSDKASLCFVCTELTYPAVLKRLQFFVTHSSGFALAEYDLERRGPGAVYGQAQSGFLSHFKIAKLSDHKLVTQTQQVATQLYPDLDKYPNIQHKVQQVLDIIHLE
ncbi:MAG: ATP-dependent DNA helicase RecG [Patescibacteria group bacterium]